MDGSKASMTEGGECGPMPSHVPQAGGCNVCYGSASRDAKSIPKGLFESVLFEFCRNIKETRNMLFSVKNKE